MELLPKVFVVAFIKSFLMRPSSNNFKFTNVHMLVWYKLQSDEKYHHNHGGADEDDADGGSE